MGGRGSSSGADSNQITLDRIILIKDILEIRDKADEIRVSMDETGIASGGLPTLRKKQCFCCEEFTLPPLSEYEECENCGWIDDKFQNTHPESPFGRNAISRKEARKRFFT
jgi:hypothetical protein